MTETPTRAQQSTIGFIGAGKMGGPIVRLLLEADQPVALWARRAGVRESLESAGALIVSTPDALAASVDTLITCLYNDEQVTEVLIKKGGVIDHMRPGALLIIHSTLELKTCRALAEAAARRGILILDAPLSGTAVHVQQKKLTVLIAGSPDATERGREVIKVYSPSILDVAGEFGSASILKLLNNTLFALNAESALAVARAAVNLGLDPKQTLKQLVLCTGTSNALSELSRASSLEGFMDSARPYFEKDMAAARASADLLETDLGAVDRVMEQFDIAPSGTDSILDTR